MGHDQQILIFQCEPSALFSNAKQRDFTSKNNDANVSKAIKPTGELYHQVLSDCAYM